MATGSAVGGDKRCGRPARAAAVPGRGHPDRQRRRIRLDVHYHVLDKGIGHVYIKPRTPRLNGKVERSHRIDAEEFYRMLDGVVIDDAKILNTKLREWEDYYHYHRPHGGLGGQTPSERLGQKTLTPGVADQRQSHTGFQAIQAIGGVGPMLARCSSPRSAT